MVQIVRISTCPPIPWKNGAGSTRELWRAGDAADPAMARISIAEVSGEQGFSLFPGIDRIIMQLDGPAMDLKIGGTLHRLAVHQPLAFAGEAQVSCKVAGAGLAHDLNLMCHRDAYRGDMRVEKLAPQERLDVGHGTAMVAVLALAPCELSQPVATWLAAHDMVISPYPFTLFATEATTVAIISVAAVGANAA
jgi:environmental stress-induced protein Ves